MRILFISERYPPHLLGGYEIACASIASGLRQRGHEVSVLTSDFTLNHDVLSESGIIRMLHYKQSATNLLQLMLWEIRDNRVLKKILLNWKPDVIYVWSVLHLFPSLHRVIKQSDIATVYNIQDSWLPRHLKEVEQLRQLWMRPSSSRAKTIIKRCVKSIFKCFHSWFMEPIQITDINLDNIIFCSELQHASYRENQLPLSNYTVVHNGFDVSATRDQPERSKNESLRVLFVGRLVKEKGAHVALEAIEELLRRGYQNIHLSIVAIPAHPWEYGAELQRRADSGHLSLHVRWLGMIANADLPAVYQEHDVLAFPSTHIEGLPMTILEAMASGLAVIGTTTGGSVEILKKDVNGLVIPPEDPVALADCLVRLVRNRDLCRTLGQAGQKTVQENFSLSSVISKTEEFIGKCIFLNRVCN